MPDWNRWLAPLLRGKALSRLAGLVTLLLVVALGHAAARLTWVLWPQPPERAAPPRMLGGASVSAGPERTPAAETIAALHLFGEANRARPAPRPRRVTAPTTPLNLTLVGVVAGDDPGDGGAIISEPRGGQQYYPVGGWLKDVPGQPQLVAVFSDRVIIERNGRQETLPLKREGVLSTELAAAGEAPRAGAPTAPVASRLASLRDEVLEDPGSLDQLIRARPVYRGGKLRGFRVSPGKDRELFNELGFRAGDLVTGVNGVVLDDPVKGVQLLKDLRDAGQLSVDVTRRGRPLTLTVDLR
jgi:general secretion pathway protein C